MAIQRRPNSGGQIKYQNVLKKGLRDKRKMSEEKCEITISNEQSCKRDANAIDESGESSSKNVKIKLETPENGENNRKRKMTDEVYFQAYADLAVHGAMLADDVRTTTYRKAIFKNYEKFLGKTVLDVGCGTGILSMFCAQAGAKMVYAVDASDIIRHAESIIKSNNLTHKITLIKGKMEEVTLPEKVDIIVSEWMGYMLLYETMLPSVLFARDRWLKPEGLMFPERAVLYMAPCCDNEGFDGIAKLWKAMNERYKVDMSAMIPVAESQYTEAISIRSVMPHELMAHSSLIQSLNLHTLSINQLSFLESKFKFNCFGWENIHGFALWFTVTFPGDIHLSTSPDNLETHWLQTVLHIEPRQVHQGTIIHGVFTVKPNKDNKRFLDIQMQYKIGKQKFEKNYLMDGHIKF